MVRHTVFCQHRNRSQKYKYDDIAIFECGDCALVFTPLRKSQSSGKVLYSNYYKNEVPARFRFGLEYVVRLFRFFRAYKLSTIHPQAREILDIGSGRGLTLYYLKKYYRYQKTVGTQLCKKAVEYSRKTLGLTIYNKDLLRINFGKEKFDLITIWHVLEHVTEPEKYIKKISSLLRKYGKIVVEVPNYNSWTRRLTGKYWLGLDLDYHLTFFTPKTISLLVNKFKLKITKVHTFSLEYSTFISVQSLVSKITKTDQLLFKWLQTKDGNFPIVFHVFLFILLTPICLIINLLLYYSKRGEVILLIAKKTGK
jgi:2-polyprenyl-3-methyl-5-hydroxy-6-metoxy-1,4-benzoquinol methylase